MEELFDIMAGMVDSQRRASDATGKGAVAFERLLRLAERQDTGRARRVAGFVASVYDGATFFPFDPFELRAVDLEISDDMLMCLDALRWGKADLNKLVPNGSSRSRALIDQWGLQPPSRGYE